MQYYVHKNGQTFGPYPKHTVFKMALNKQISSTDYVCLVGDKQWTAVKDTFNLAPIAQTRKKNKVNSTKKGVSFSPKKSKKVSSYTRIDELKKRKKENEDKQLKLAYTIAWCALFSAILVMIYFMYTKGESYNTPGTRIDLLKPFKVHPDEK